MSRIVTLPQLRAQTYRRADVENAEERFPLGEVNDYINQSFSELYDLLCDSEQDYYLTSTTISVVASTEGYDLPSDFFRIRGVDISLNGTPLEVDRWKFEERRLYAFSGQWGIDSKVAYHLTASQIQFKPTPTTAVTATLWYYPAPPTMIGESDSMDGVAGWEEFVVLGAAIKMLDKDNRDASRLIAERDRQEARILSQSSRSNDIPHRVIRRRNVGLLVPGFGTR